MLIEEPKEELVNMTEDLRQKERRLSKELAQVRALNANKDTRVKKSRDMTMGFPADNSHKASPSSADIPDVVTLPPKRRGKKENIPF